MYVDPDGTKAKWWNPTTWNWKKIGKKIKKTLKIAGSVIAGIGLGIAVTGVVLTLVGIPIGPKIVALGILTYMVGMYVLVLIGEVDPNKQDFPEWPKKSKQGHYINLGGISNNEKMY